MPAHPDAQARAAPLDPAVTRSHVARRQFLAIAAIFLLESFAFAAWLPRLPEMRDRLVMDEGALGIILLGPPLGSLLAMPVTGWLTTRLPLPRLMMGAMMLNGLALPVMAWAETPFHLLLSLALLGLGTGAYAATMNFAAYAVECAYARPIMSRCHAAFSAGGVLGAAIGSLCLSEGVSVGAELVCIGGGLILSGWFLSRLLPGTAPRRTRRNKQFSLPAPGLIGLSFLAFCALLADGIMIDWSSLYARDVLGAPKLLTGLGLAAFSLAMFTGRWCGDWICQWLPADRILRWAGLLTVLGVAAIIASDTIAPASLGFFLVGLGLATLYPILARKAAQSPGAPGVNMAAIATIGYLGFLLGPPSIGALAAIIGLKFAIGLVGVAAGILTLGAAWLRTRPDGLPSSARPTGNDAVPFSIRDGGKTVL